MKKSILSYGLVFGICVFLLACASEPIVNNSPNKILTATSSPKVIEHPDFDIVVVGNKVEIKKYKGNATEVIIPEKIADLNVSVIQAEAFSNNHIIETVTIPRYIERVQNNAFDNCSNLKKIILIDIRSNRIIDKDAFSNTGMVVIKSAEKSSFERPYQPIVIWNENTLEYSYYYTVIKPENGFYTTEFGQLYEYFTYLGKEYGPCGYTGQSGHLKISMKNGKIFFTGLGFKNSAFIGYNDKLYLAIKDSDSAWYKIGEDDELIYIKRIFDSNNQPFAQLFIDDAPISSIYSDIEIIDYSPDDICYIGYKDKTHFACKNEKVIAQRDGRFYDIQFVNNSVYYKNDDYSAKSILKNNGEIIINAADIGSFTVSNDEKNIAYTSRNRDGSTSILKNGKEHYRSPGMILNPVFSPDGNKLYFLEAGQDRGALAFVINGPNIPLSIAGPYLRPSGYNVVSFSNDSKYVAFVLEAYRGTRGMCIILNDKRYGPYGNVRNYHFSEDSKTYSFEYYENGKWNQQTISLK